MNKLSWNVAGSPLVMVHHMLKKRTTVRLWRLLVTALARLAVKDTGPWEAGEAAVVALEALAERTSQENEAAAYTRAGNAYDDALQSLPEPYDSQIGEEHRRLLRAGGVLTAAAEAVCDVWGHTTKQPPTVPALAALLDNYKDSLLEGRQEREAEQLKIIYDIFGDPFEPRPRVRRTDRVRRLGRGIYKHKAFGDLPVLADALEEEGRTDTQLLAHLRRAGPHWRGCWALDAVICSRPNRSKPW